MLLFMNLHLLNTNDMLCKSIYNKQVITYLQKLRLYVVDEF